MKRIFKRLLSSIVIIGIMISFTLAPVFASNYSDTKTHWAKDRIARWTSLGIFTGANNKFRPNDFITRGELAIVLNNIMKFQTKADNNFTDLDEKFYTDALLKANKAGIINGSNKKIRPKDKATREEAAVMLVKALSIKANDQADYLRFQDSAQISNWAVSSVNALSNNGYVNGNNKNKFNPKSNITRAEIVTILDNCIKAIYSQEGTYGDNTINRNVIINSPNITLKDMTINGNLIISQGAAEGTITLENVKVSGEIIVYGGAYISLIDSIVSGMITINKDNGNINLIATGSTTVEKILLNSGAIIDSKALKTGEIKCVEISSNIPKGHIIKLIGTFKLVINNAKDIIIEAEGLIEELILNQKCQIKGGVTIKKTTPDNGTSPESNGTASNGSTPNTSPSNPTTETTKYTVTFNSNGGSAVQPVSVISGEKLVMPSAPTYPGYVFMGWFTDKGLTTEFKSNTLITSNITLYAKWSGWNKPVIRDERFEDGYPKFNISNDNKIKLVVKLKDASIENPVDVFMLVNQMNPLFDATVEEVIHGHSGAVNGLVEVDDTPFIRISDTNEHEIATQVTVKGNNNIKMYFVLKGSSGVISQEPTVIELQSSDVALQDNTAPKLYNNGVYINKSYDRITLYFDDVLNLNAAPLPGDFTIAYATTSSSAITVSSSITISEAIEGDVNTISPSAIAVPNSYTSPGAISVEGISVRNIASDKGVVELSVKGITDINNLLISYNKPYGDEYQLQDNATTPNTVESFINVPVKAVSYSVSQGVSAVSTDGKYIYIKMNFALLDYNSFDITINKGPDSKHLTPVNDKSDILRIWSNAGDYHKLYICLDETPTLLVGDKYYVTLTPAPRDGTSPVDFSGDIVTSVINIELTPSTIQEISVTPDRVEYDNRLNAIKVNLPQVHNLFSDGSMFGCLFTLNVDGISYTLRGKVFVNNGQIVINQKNVPTDLSKIDWSKASLSYSPLIHNCFDSDNQLIFKSGMPYGGFTDLPITIVP